MYAREWNGSSAGIDEDGSETGRRRVEIEMTSVGSDEDGRDFCSCAL